MSIAGSRTARAAALAAASAALVTGTQAADAATKYVYRPIAFIDAPAPGGGTFVTDFEPSNINDRGTVAFTADASTGGEGVWQFRDGDLVQIARTGMRAPGGSRFGANGELGVLGLNDADDMTVPFFLEPASPFGLNGAVFRYTAATGALRPIARPGTKAPTGGRFRGVRFNTSLNNAGDAVFTGLAPGTDIDPSSGPGTLGIVSTVFKEHNGVLSAVVRPGDPAPGGGVFDTAQDARINNLGDVSFGGHVAGEECIGQSRYECFESVYVKRADGVVESVAHQGQAAPGGGTFRVAYGALINDARDVAFSGDLTKAPGVLESVGVFLRHDGKLLAIARPGQAMPGGGRFVTASQQAAGIGLNEDGDVGFIARLDTDVNEDGEPDTGAYLWSGGTLQLVARTGTVVPGIGTIAWFGEEGAPTPISPGGQINDADQMVLNAVLEGDEDDGDEEEEPEDNVLLRASPLGTPGA